MGSLAWWVRPFVYGVLLLFAACAVLGLEWWPFTGWRLFSTVRTSTSASYQVVSVDSNGREHPLGPRAHPDMRPYQRFVNRVWAYDAAEKKALCETWARVAGRSSDVRGVRVYRVVRAVPRRGERRGAEVGRSRFLTCDVPT